jgi:hypothetical protein
MAQFVVQSHVSLSKSNNNETSRSISSSTTATFANQTKFAHRFIIQLQENRERESKLSMFVYLAVPIPSNVSSTAVAKVRSELKRINVDFPATLH